MNWADFYLVCFLVGFLLSLLSLLAGSVHVHLPHLDVHFGGGHMHAPHAPAGGHGGEPSALNFGTIAAFLAWFGGAGYLMSRYYAVWALLGLSIAILSGLAGAAIVFWFFAKVLVSREENLDAADYDMVGVLGRITIPIRPAGTGELVYSQQGTRRSTGARSEDGTPIPKGVEVIVTRYERGLAYVRRWEES
jgi:membrane protein implicated in regulation of membrane protease activity